MPTTVAAPIIVLLGAFGLASTSALADDGGAKLPGKPPTPLVEVGKDGKGSAKAPPTKKAKGWNEMTRGEKKAANDLYLSRPKKWDDMTPAEQDAAKKAWFFSTGDFGPRGGWRFRPPPKAGETAAGPKQNVPSK